MSRGRPEASAPGTRGAVTRTGGDCDCRPSWQPSVWSNRERRRIVKTFSSQSAAKAWRREVQVALDRGISARHSCDASGGGRGLHRRYARRVRAERKGERYKPSAIRGYERTLRLRVLPVLGAMRLSEIERSHVQALADDLVAQGLAPATVLNYLDPLRAIFQRAVRREEVAVNPTTWLDLPRPGGGRDRIAAPEEAAALVAALPTEDRALWATAI